MTFLVVAAGIVVAVLCLLIVSSLITRRFTPWSKNSERFRDAPLAFFLQKSILILILVSLIIGIWEVIT